MRDTLPGRTVRVVALLCVGGLAGIGYATRHLWSALGRHWALADTLPAYLQTLQTYAVELWIETDFIPLVDTVIGWTGLLALLAGAGITLHALRDTRQTSSVARPDAVDRSETD